MGFNSGFKGLNKLQVNNYLEQIFFGAMCIMCDVYIFVHMTFVQGTEIIQVCVGRPLETTNGTTARSVCARLVSKMEGFQASSNYSYCNSVVITQIVLNQFIYESS